MAEFECRLKKYRQLKEMTQEQLAEKVGVRRETIMRLEKAQYNPSLKSSIVLIHTLSYASITRFILYCPLIYGVCEDRHVKQNTT